MSWRGTLHTLPTGAARAGIGMGRPSLLPSSYACVLHVYSRVIKESPLEYTTWYSSLVKADKESTALALVTAFSA